MTRIALVLITFSVHILTVSALDCTYPYNGTYYDLSPLSNNNEDYNVTLFTGMRAWINVCREVITTVCYNCCGAGIAGCQQWDPDSVNGQASMGTISSETAVASEKGVTLQFSGGLAQRSMEIDFLCDPDAGQGYPIYQGRGSHSQFQWNSAQACLVPPNSHDVSWEGLDLGALFLIGFSGIFLLYCTFGYGVNLLVFGKKGKDAIPHWAFWSSVPGLAKDGIVFVAAKLGPDHMSKDSYEKF